jgi:ribosome-associated heat shock protein Hsp15
VDKVRIDKWLWAARFYKTRSLAKQAIDSGKVRCEGQRIKASKDLTTGLLLSIRNGWDEREIEVVALADVRRGASEAQRLYCETAHSIEKRLQKAAEYKALHQYETPSRRPTKKQRRQIHRFREQDLD